VECVHRIIDNRARTRLGKSQGFLHKVVGEPPRARSGHREGLPDLLQQEHAEKDPDDRKACETSHFRRLEQRRPAGYFLWLPFLFIPSALLVTCGEDKLITVSNTASDTVNESISAKMDPRSIRWVSTKSENSESL